MLRRSTEPHPVSIATAKGGIKKARMHSTKHFALHGIIQYFLKIITDLTLRNRAPSELCYLLTFGSIESGCCHGYATIECWVENVSPYLTKG